MLAASIIWGLNAPIGKAALDFGIPPLALTTFRFFGAAIAFWFISLFTKKERVKNEDLLMLFFAALFGIVLNQGTFIFGLSLTSPIDASIVTTMAVFVLLVETLAVAIYSLKLVLLKLNTSESDTKRSCLRPVNATVLHDLILVYDHINNHKQA